MRALILAVLLAGCTAIDHGSAQSDWPQLEIVEFRTTGRGLSLICHDTLLSQAFACMRPDFDAGVCFIWRTDDTPQWALEHEREHCLYGKDHALGAPILRDYYDAWKAKKK